MLRLLIRYPIYLKLRQKRYSRAVTLIELLLTVAILGTLSAIAMPIYTGYVDKQRDTTAIVDINNIASKIDGFQALNGRPPNDFAEAGINPTPLDPWGNPYEYLRIGGIDPLPPHTRKDKSTKPLSSDFDLYSQGKDGKSDPSLTGKPAWDDIIRANNGGYIGLASEY